MTRHKKDIETLFRESEHKLSERPSSQTWRKLERKLDNRRGRHRVLPMRFISMAAALVALIAVVWVFSSTFNSNKPDNQSGVKLNFELEDFESTEKPVYKRDQVSEYMAHFTSQNSNTAINEGPREKSLVSKKNRDI